MTRINLIHPSKLCDKHLMAEYRELVRIPNGIVSGRLKSSYPDAPKVYTLGTGHIKFFVTRCAFLYMRHGDIYKELKYRGFNVTYINWSDTFDSIPMGCKWNYFPTQEETDLNISRIIERMPSNPKWTNRLAPVYWTSYLN